jgi:hypothetical protein
MQLEQSSNFFAHPQPQSMVPSSAKIVSGKSGLGEEGSGFDEDGQVMAEIESFLVWLSLNPMYTSFLPSFMAREG